MLVVLTMINNENKSNNTTTTPMMLLLLVVVVSILVTMRPSLNVSYDDETDLPLVLIIVMFIKAVVGEKIWNKKILTIRQ